MKKRNLSALFLILPGLAGCEGRAGTDYQGEPLMSLTGSVVIDNMHAPSELVPALAFYSAGENLLIQEVDVSGEFPARFTLDVYEPPPDAAIATPDPELYSGESKLAIGYVTAVAPDHPDTITSDNTGAGASQGCYPPLEEGDPSTMCFQTQEWCKGESCYVESYNCDPTFTNCELVETTGDPDLAKSTWQHFAGLSRNYMVLYLVSDVEADSWVAYNLSADEGLHAGYHLIRKDEFTAEERAVAEECWDAARSEAYATYNAEHGTSYTGSGDFNGQDDWEQIEIDLDRLESQAMMDLGCVPESSTKLTVVESGADHPITVEIGTDVEPLGGF